MPRQPAGVNEDIRHEVGRVRQESSNRPAASSAGTNAQSTIAFNFLRDSIRDLK
jgi:hypothetical protein